MNLSAGPSRPDCSRVELSRSPDAFIATRPPLSAAVAAACAALSLAPAPAACAQYFGQNKVQYRDFDFKVLKTQHFDIYYYPEEEAAVEQAGAPGRALVRAALARCSTTASRARQPLILYASHPHFEQTNVARRGSSARARAASPRS